MIAIGIGCRRGVTKEAITSLITEARSLASITSESIALFTHERKRDEVGLIAAADELGLSLHFMPTDALRAAEDRVVTRSRHSEEVLGISSISEAAALAGAGAGSHLLLRRIVGEGATCAVARGRDR